MTESNHHAHSTEPVDYDLTCWYLNCRRVLEPVGVEAAPQKAGLSSRTALNTELVALKDALVAWLNSAKPPTVRQLSIKGELSSMPFEKFAFFAKSRAESEHKKLDSGRNVEKSLHGSYTTNLMRAYYSKIRLS